MTFPTVPSGLPLLFDAAPLGIAILDARGRVVDANPAFRCMTGREAEDLRGRSAADLAAPDDRPGLAQWLAGAPSAQAQRFTLQRPDGSALVCSLTASAIDLEGHRLRQVALRDGADHPRCLAGRMHEIVDQHIHRADRISPEAGDVTERAALAELAFLADDARKLLELVRHALVALDDVVEHVGDASQRAWPVRGKPHRGVASLQRVQIPPAPTDDYGTTYDTLKAYLITTSEWKRSTSWLSPVLISRWAGGRQVDNILPLAKKQFDFYSADLARSNPFSEKNDGATIDRARLHLSKFSGIEQVYQFMLSDASRRAKKINFNEQFPGSAEVVINNRDVAGAFTKAGWAAMQENIKKSDKFFGGERWVLGDYASAKPDPAEMEEELRNRYTSDYMVAAWGEGYFPYLYQKHPDPNYDPVSGGNMSWDLYRQMWGSHGEYVVDGNLVSLFRDNRRSGFLYRSFSIDNGRLGTHPIMTGEGLGARVTRVMTYTGQSLDGPPGAAGPSCRRRALGILPTGVTDAEGILLGKPRNTR